MNPFEAILNATTESIFLVDTQGVVLAINETAAQRLNQTRDSLEGQCIFAFFPPEVAAIRRRNLEEVVRSGQARHTEDQRGARYFSLNYYPMQNDAGTVESVVVYAADITTQKLAQNALQDSEALKSSVLTHAAYAIIATDVQGIITVFNPGAETLLGYRADEVVGQKSPGLFHLRSEVVERAQAASLQHGGEVPSGFEFFTTLSHRTPQPEESEWTYVRKDGSHVPVQLSITPRVDTAGQVIGYLGIAQDITARRQVESDLRIAAIAFESQEGMLVTDADRIILRVNRAFTDITGYSADEAIGQTPRLLSSGRHDTVFYDQMRDSLQRNGTWQGEVVNRHKAGSLYTEWLTITAVKNGANRVTNYVATITDITSRKAAHAEINSLAFYDPLTGLPNRRLLLDRLKHAVASSARSGRHGALLFIDLDNFKTLNDTLGHDFGDLLLKEVARQLESHVREGDTVARFGGDEFVVILDDLGESAQDAATQAEVVGEKILGIANHAFQLGAHAHRCTLSAGVALFFDHQSTVDELLKRADLAMYQAKAAGRNALRFFDPNMQSVVTTRANLEADLHEAILNNQFALYYRPQVDQQGHLTGVEALLRWQHPKRGLVSPLEFIPLAEETGTILPLGQWVLQTACQQLVRWARQPALAHLTIAVNVSARQLHHRDFVSQVLALLDHTGANPQRLKLELTESHLVSDVEGVIAKMATLKARGVGFSLDDFGTGYSSLSYLKRLPLDQLKIDQSFVRSILTDSNDAAIAKMVVALAESLGLAVIAEGVEQDAQRAFLAQQGCYAYQGYLFGRPVPLEEFERQVARLPD
jgi:diguanylate cyclase (GGDEF)-like protein/PAS domain S-box-containing protein